MSYLTVPLPFREARYMAEHIRGVTLRRHQVPPPELLQVHTDLMVRLCYLHPDIEDRDVNKLVMMCMIHDLNQVIANDETIPQDRREWEERETIFYLETRLKPSNPALAQALFNLWKEYGANETFLAKLFREIRDLVRFHRAFMHEKRAQRIYSYHYIERLRLCIGSEWLQVIADSILDSWIVVKEIQNAGPIYFVFGGPGSGKTFVCERLSATHGLEHISLGALIEEEANDPSSAHGIAININRNQGRPIPMDLSINLLKDRLRQADGSGILIDGFPASMDELREFEKEITPRYSTIYLNCSAQTMVARVQRRWREEARAEDCPQLTQTRVINFATTMTPILTHLSQNPFERIFSGGSKRMTLARVERALRHNLNGRSFHAIPEDV